MVGGALPELSQPKAGRGLRWAGADALAKRIRRPRARRVQSRQSAAADNDDPTCLAVVATSAEFGAGAMVPGTRQTQWTPAQDDDRRAGAQTAGRALEICDRRRRRRGRRDEGCLIDLEEIKYLKRYTPSTETRSVSADPGGRTDGRHGLNSRLQEWSRLPEPYPPQAGYWCSRFARRPNVRLIWCGNDQIMELGSDLGCRNSQRSFPHAPLNLSPPLTRTSPCEADRIMRVRGLAYSVFLSGLFWCIPDTWRFAKPRESPHM